MPGAKYNIERKCLVCGVKFYARQIESRFCSQKCSKKFSKKKRREELRQNKLNEISQKIPDTRDFISVKEATALYAVCRDTLYRLIRLNKIYAVNLNKRLIRVSRKELDIHFTKREVALTNKDKPIPKLYSLEPHDCFTVGEVTEVFGISEKTVYEMIRRHSIPTRQIGRFVYIPKSDIIDVLNITLK